MEVNGGDDASTAAPFAKWRRDFSRGFQYYLDRSTPLPVHRWLGTLAVASIYVLRVYCVQGFYIISYGLGTYILNLLIGFLSPKVDPELEVLDGASLPTNGSDEFKPFVRRLPEFKFCMHAKGRNIDHFMEELIQEQEMRERRNQEREQLRDGRHVESFSLSTRFDELPDEFDPTGKYGSFDDGDPQITNLYVGNLAPRVSSGSMKIGMKQ